MSDAAKHFNAQLFEGLKTACACRYQSEFELRLMQQFESAEKVRSYHQPSIIAMVKNPGILRYITIDFWIEYQDERVDLVYIEKSSFLVGEKADIFFFSDKNNLPEAFGFVAVNERSGNFRRIRSENLKLSSDIPDRQSCFVNFNWIN